MKINKTKRLHDILYLKENRYKNPKENFKFVMKLIKQRINKNKKYKLLDIGCANGELLWNLNRQFKNLDLYGLDIRYDLIQKAKKACKDIKFFRKNISKKKIKVGKFDIIIISGVLSCLDNPLTVIKNLKQNLKSRGIVFLFDNFSDTHFNNYHQYQDIKKNKNILQSGYNMYSLEFLKKTFKKIFKIKKLETKQFNIKKSIKKNKKDLMRSWTITIGNKRYFTNGTGLILKQFWLIAKT